MRAMCHSTVTNNKVDFVSSQLKDCNCCCCNNIIVNMDVESYRNTKVKYFVESIGMAHCSKWKEFTTDLGVQVTEELKLITKVEWDELFTQIKASKIQRRKFDVAIDSLNATGPADPTIN